MNIKKMIRHLVTQIYLILNEKKYKGRLKYLYKSNSSDTLLVVFSGFADKPVYNYIRTLSNVCCDKLFILDDFGYRGSYYWYEDGLTHPLDLVTSLLRDLGGGRRIVTLGSSKGGTCALFYGLMFDATDIYAGACQYYVGTYLNAEDKVPVFKGMMGNTATKKDQEILDRMMPDMICKHRNSKSVVHLLYSDKEHTYPEHIKYFISVH